MLSNSLLASSTELLLSRESSESWVTWFLSSSLVLGPQLVAIRARAKVRIRSGVFIEEEFENLKI
jgi:hypothetical protein